MHLIKNFKHRRRQERERKELHALCAAITAITVSLPAELWTIIIEALVRDLLGHPLLQCHELPELLRYRLVCHSFDKDVKHFLHQNILFAQIPRLPIMRAYREESRKPKASTLNFHTSLLASSIYNSSNYKPRSYRAWQQRQERFEANTWGPRSNIVYRIENCVTIASAISSETRTSTNNLKRSLSIAASKSDWARDYMFVPHYFLAGFNTFKEAEIHLEVALLVASGYDKASVLSALKSVGGKNVLRPYQPGWPNEVMDIQLRLGIGLRLKTYIDARTERLSEDEDPVECTLHR